MFQQAHNKLKMWWKLLQKAMQEEESWLILAVEMEE